MQQKGGAVKSFEMFSLQDRFGNACIAYFAYLGKMIRPSGLAVYYPHPGSVGSRSAVLALVALIAISGLSVCMWRRRAYFPVGWFWYLGTLIPGIAIIAAWGIPDLLRPSTARAREALAFAAGCTAAAMCIATVQAVVSLT